MNGPSGAAGVTARTAAVEDYLKAIYGLEERGGGPVTTTAVARHLGLTVSTVSEMVRRLGRDELVTHQPYGSLELTAEGRRSALLVLRRHRLVETYLVEALGYGWDEVHDEAEVLEHVISDRMVERMADRLDHPERDPHGDPIPGPDGTVRSRPTRRLSALRPGERGVLARVADTPPGLLRWLTDHGVALGDHIEVVGWEPGGSLRVRMGGGDEPLAFGEAVASSIGIAGEGTAPAPTAP